MLQAAAETPELDAVVSEGAGARTLGDELNAESKWYDKPGIAVSYALRDMTVAIETGETPPEHLRRVVERIAQPTLLIAAPNSPQRRDGSTASTPRAREPKRCGRSRSPGTSSGIEARPAEYERRVVGFFDKAL